jgi:hypothetical protein
LGCDATLDEVDFVEELLMLGRRLYGRRQNGIVIPYKGVDASHRENDCHQNASTWARDHLGCKVIHGWMVFDIERAGFSLVIFNPHSIIETDDGERRDITPSGALQRYPFLDHEGDAADFVRIVYGNSVANLSYDPEQDTCQVNGYSFMKSISPNLSAAEGAGLGSDK